MNELVKSGFCSEDELTDFFSYFSFDVESYIIPVIFEANKMILFEGSEPQRLYYMFEGRGKLYVTKENGKTLLIRFLNPGSFIGEVELLGDVKEALSVKALMTCKCFALPLGLLREKLLSDVVFLRKISAYLLAVSASSRESSMRIGAGPLKNRLAGFIIRNLRDGVYQVRHTEAADYLGVSYRHLLYVFEELVSGGILKKEKRRFTVLDMEGLLALERQTE